MLTKLYCCGKAIPCTIVEEEQEFRLSFPYYKPLLDEIKSSIEARRFDFSNKCWYFKKTARNKFVLSYLKGENPFALYDQPLKNYPTASDLWYHQQKMYSHIMTRRRVIIAGEMRTGKTRPTLQAIQDLKIEGAWWIAPKSALKGLKLELLKWNFPYEIYLSTYDKFRSIYDGSNDVPQFIVFDECQKLKNPTSKQGKLARIIGERQLERWKDVSYLTLLSGTPSPKEPPDWWNLAEICCPGFLKENSKMTLSRRLGEYEERDGKMGNKYWHLIKWNIDEVAFMHKRLEGLTETFFKKDCLDLPDKVYTKVYLDMTADYKNAIAMLRKTEASALTLLNKLRQLSDGFLYLQVPDGDSAKMRRKTEYFPNCPKDEQLKEDLDMYEDEGRIIVYCGFQASVEKIVAICIKKGWAVLKADGQGWNALNTLHSVDTCLEEMSGSLAPRDRKVEKLAFVAQADAASTGLELSASSVVVYYSNSFKGEARMQSEDRAHSNNMDKERGLEIKDYIHLPVDELALDNLLKKKTMQGITLGQLFKTMEL